MRLLKIGALPHIIAAILCLTTPRSGLVHFFLTLVVEMGSSHGSLGGRLLNNPVEVQALTPLLSTLFQQRHRNVRLRLLAFATQLPL